MAKLITDTLNITYVGNLQLSRNNLLQDDCSCSSAVYATNIAAFSILENVE